MTSADHEFHPDTYIARALAVAGGHLQIGRGGYCLHYAQGATLSGYDCDAMKEACTAAGLPVIDSRNVAFAVIVDLAVHGPMVAVGRDPDPQPWHMFSCAPLKVIAAAYARAGRRRSQHRRYRAWCRHGRSIVMSSRPLFELYTTTREFEDLHARHDRSRSTSKTVTIDRQALIHILMDHTRMLDALRRSGRVKVIDPD